MNHTPTIPDHKLDSSLRAMLEPDEHAISVVRRHPIGIILLWLEAFVFITVLLTVFYLAIPDVFRSITENSTALITGIVLLAVALLVLVLFVATYIYNQNILLITNQNLVQANQYGLFSRKVSRLSIANVEDVSAEQTGILPSLFNYGVLHIQTAGERPNFNFKYCPDPNKYAIQINQARQEYAESLQERP